MGKSHETLIKQLTLKSQNMRSEWVPDRHGGIWVGTRQKHSLVVAMVKTEVVNCIQVSVRYHNCKVGWSQNEELICLKRKNDRHVVTVKKYACHSWLHKLPSFDYSVKWLTTLELYNVHCIFMCVEFFF